MLNIKSERIEIEKINYDFTNIPIDKSNLQLEMKVNILIPKNDNNLENIVKLVFYIHQKPDKTILETCVNGYFLLNESESFEMEKKYEFLRENCISKVYNSFLTFFNDLKIQNSAIKEISLPSFDSYNTKN